ncbi:AAA family ATPase [Spirulina major CS-329]|uniref:AAA family ATPase n=1 Tax=Spirulina TaxID=1154 RepID=UPI00232DE26D|nr:MULTISPECIES: AAA family ATPase [Spirulina]MDB9496660.1 AAA family ATPase [Spirulina subsalsa CS-330]MDB9503363.1 AAA family ATPase [Spirulina major CS-329]
MSTEKLKIQNFAGLKDVEIEIKKINIFIGPQASGKSVIAKLLFYFKGIFNDIIKYGKTSKNKRDFDKKIKDKFENYFPAYTWKNNEFHLYYVINNEFICIEKYHKIIRNFCFCNLSLTPLGQSLDFRLYSSSVSVYPLYS